ncbi:MAG: heat-inducible transcription repressor HrcA [Thermomicrobiales bacterium]|nr:heat-inducible transcription repressor HrcA [Thermomicrobiales bacterium]
MPEHIPNTSDGVSSIELTERQQGVLRLIIHEYVSSGRPVGSKHLTEQYPIGVSSATIRNEMSELEQKGYVEHLHTSGGRVPTDAGYRYFVRNLMSDVEVPPGDQIMIRHQFKQMESQLEDWPELAASILAGIAGNVSVVTAPRAPITRLRHMELISLQSRLALLILVTLESTVRQLMLHLPDEATQEELSALADDLNMRLRGRSADELRFAIERPSALAATVIDQIESTLRMADAARQTPVRASGLENMLGQPGVENPDIQAVLDLAYGGGILHALLPRMETGSNLSVFIGDDQLPGELKRLGVIVSTYGVEGHVSGLLGVVGPTRMSYWRTISTVRYMSRLISDLVADLYPGPMEHE